MADEIERKFLLPDAPAPGEIGDGRRIRQGYVALDGDVEVRIRLFDDDARLTVKAGSGLVRTEVEVPVGEHEGRQLWEHAEGRRIDKVRYRRDLGAGLVAEVDVYEGALAGLCTVEVEFPDAEQAAAFAPPPWFGRELTGDRRWSNAALACDGIPS
jgi:CYTH domain-containing protein